MGQSSCYKQQKEGVRKKVLIQEPSENVTIGKNEEEDEYVAKDEQADDGDGLINIYRIGDK